MNNTAKSLERASRYTNSSQEAPEVSWVNAIFLVVLHITAVFGIYYSLFISFSWWNIGLGLLWACFTGISITGGYHRLFAHRAYQCNPALKLFYLVFGAAAVQNSAIKWVADHREHHGHTDHEDDPYNIQKGFWWAHLGWVLYKEEESDIKTVPDLLRDPMVKFQMDYYVPLAIVFGGLMPMGIGLLWGDPLGAFLWAGVIRLVLVYHATFCVNSLAHYIGKQPYSTRDSSKDSFITALATLGEGYHNFHHRFPTDYRNGIRAWHYDPTKWFVWTLSKVGVTSELKRVPRERIQKALDECKRRASGVVSPRGKTN